MKGLIALLLCMAFGVVTLLVSWQPDMPLWLGRTLLMACIICAVLAMYFGAVGMENAVSK